MARLIVSAAVAAVTFYATGGNVAATSAAFSATYGVTGFLDPGTTIYGPRLDDLRVQVSSYGLPIPRGYGGFPAAGNVIWSTDLVPHEESESVGKGGPSQTQVTTTYTVSCAIALCEGPIAGVRRIWADSKLVYDARDDADADTLAASSEFAEFFTLYLGTETQEPDPTMEAELGAGNVPGYRGTAYIVFADLPLGDYGNRIPNFLFEVFTEGTPATVQGDGLLCHFDALNGDGEVISAVGPNLTLTNGATLDGDAKFGDASGGRTGTSNAEHTATGITGTAGGRSWRIEWWQKATTTTNFGWVMIFDNPSSGASIELGGSMFSAFSWDIQSSSINGGGGIGNVEPTLDEWQHVAIQYRDDIEQFAIFLHGQRIGNFSTVGDPYPVGTWGTDTFTRFRWLGTQTGVLIDELYYHFDPDTLYGDAYTVPTAPFDATDGGETFTPGQVFLPDVVEALCLEGGLEASEIDVTDLPNTEVLGYVRTKQMSTRAAIEPLRQAFYFDAVESEGKVKFISRGGSSLVTIDDDDLGAVEGESDPQPATEPVRAQEAELPAVVNVVYLDRDRDYENGTQTARRVVTGSVQQTTLEMPIVLTNQHASDAASVNLYDAWTARTEISWSTTKRYAKYEPTDIVTLVDGAISRQVRITDKSEEGPVIKWRGRDDKPAIYDPNTTPNTPSGQGASIRITGDTVVELIDSPIFRDADDDAGFYVAARGTRDGWTGGVLYQSTDGGTSYSSLKTVTQRATMGATDTALGNWTGGYVVDEVNTVDVQLDSGTLSTITRDSLLDGGQAAIIGNEVVGFQRATLIGEDQYRLSGLLRGMRGTEDQISEHAVSDRFVLISAANWYRVDQLLTQVGAEYLYKPVTFGKSIEAAPSEAFTNAARGLKPFSPVDLRLSADGVLTWKRRTRLSTPLFGAVPLGEASESYDVEVRDASDNVVLSTTVSEPSCNLSGFSAVFTVQAAHRIREVSGDFVGIGDAYPAASTPRIIREDSSGQPAGAAPLGGLIASALINNGDDIYVAVLNGPNPANVYRIQRADIDDSYLLNESATYTSLSAADPQGLAFDGTDLWVSGSYSGTVKRLNASTLVELNSYPINTGIGAMVHDGGDLWICDRGNDEIVQWDIGTQTETKRIATARFPTDVLVANGLVFVAAGQVQVFDASSGVLIASYVAGSIDTFRQVLVRSGSSVVFADLSTSQLVYLDDATGLETDRRPLTGVMGVSGYGAGNLFASVRSGDLGMTVTTSAYATVSVSAGYSATVYQNSASVGRGFPATLEL